MRETWGELCSHGRSLGCSSQDGPDSAKSCWGCPRPRSPLSPSSPCLQTLLLPNPSPDQLSYCWASKCRAVGNRVCLSPPSGQPPKSCTALPGTELNFSYHKICNLFPWK